MMACICPRDGNIMRETGNTDRMDHDILIAELRCPQCGHVRWDVPEKAWEVTDQYRYSNMRKVKVA